MNLRVLALALANLQQFEALFEDEGISTITAPDGETISLFDLKMLYEQRVKLPLEEAIAVEAGLYNSANGYAHDDPFIIRTVRHLCEISGMDYQEPPLEFLSMPEISHSSTPLRFLGGLREHRFHVS